MSTPSIRKSYVAGFALAMFSAVAFADDAPAFLRDTYPKPALGAALQEMGALSGKDAVLPAKMRELIGLAVAATLPCQYCIYYHTKAAKVSGASDAELKEALAHAAEVRKWSTILNGNMYSMDAFHKEVDAIFAPR